MDLNNIVPRTKRKCVLPPIIEEDEDVVKKKPRTKHTAPSLPPSFRTPRQDADVPQLTKEEEEAIENALAQITDEEALKAMAVTMDDKIAIVEAVNNNFSDEDLEWVRRLLRVHQGRDEEEEELDIDLETLDMVPLKMLHDFVCMTPQERRATRG